MLGIYAAAENYALVDIRVPVEQLNEFYQLGLAADECELIRGQQEWQFRNLPVNEWELAQLQKSKFSYLITVADAAKFYAERLSKDDLAEAQKQAVLLGTSMKLGTMGGFYKWEEVQQTLDALATQYGGRNLITQKFSIGKSFEGRELYAIKISDNADQDEQAQEKQVLYTALTHAREPQGMMTLFYFMYYLLENYDTNSRVRSIVDNHEIYIVPVVNPDGYCYNQKNYPSGGGMQRKNRNGSGIDLNRNFGPYDLWNYPNGGSSTSSYSDTYRGTAPFSEKETAALRDFTLTKNIRTALNYHTYSNLFIYPWGYKNEIAHPMFVTMAKDMTKINGYSYGTAQGLLYAVRGDSDSWFFQEPKVYAVTIEIGSSSDGFWPSSSRIFTLAEQNLEANLLLAEYADKVAK